jgi:hypothetical protein
VAAQPDFLAGLRNKFLKRGKEIFTIRKESARKRRFPNNQHLLKFVNKSILLRVLDNKNAR